ncbi:MAG: hypothetical protein JST09_19005 [Bacteroidetes bacterium]|nr:hypothetical protein [Bacteroidota bacterium]
MPIVNDTYDQLKIDKLKHYLEDMAGKGHARPFEIFVDSLKVVPKTEDPKDFDNYEYYMNENTEKIRILIYNTSLSPRNDQYCFYIQQPKQQKPLNGLGEIDNIIQEKLTARDREYELTRLQNELEETKKQLEESEEYAEDLEQQLEEARSNKYKLGKLDLVELGGVVLERLAVKNSPALEKIGLGSLINPNDKQEIPPAQETEASFQKKNTSEGELKPEYLQYIPWLQQLDAAFDQQQLEIVMQLLAKFAEDPAQLKTVAELLNISQTPKDE